MEVAAGELVKRLVAPPPRRFAFPERDAGAPFERLKRRLAAGIEARRIRFREAVQGWSRRVREPDFFYHRQDGTAVVVNVIRLDYRRSSDLSRAADASAFVLLDLQRGGNAYTVALVEWPIEPTDEFFEALKSIEAVANEVLNARDQADAIADRILEEIGPVGAVQSPLLLPGST